MDGPVSIPGWTLNYEVAEAGIANLALARLGADFIKISSEDTPACRQARAAFSATRDELLRDYEFNFAQKYAILSEVVLGPESYGSWANAYVLPTTTPILKVLEIGGNESNLFEVVGAGADRMLLCNVASTTSPKTLYIKYVEQVVDPDLWDSLFKDAFVLRLASKLAIPLVKRADMAQFLQGEFAAIFQKAQIASSKERVTEQPEVPWTERDR